MDLAIFDLDHTLLHDDSDKSWNTYLLEMGVVDKESYEASNKYWYQQYMDGVLNIHEYNQWAFRLHKEYGTAKVSKWRDEFVKTRGPGMVAKRTPEVLQWHRDRGDEILVITATSRFVAEPLVQQMGIENMLGIKIAIVDGNYTGEIVGTPTFQAGKVKALEEWLEDKPDYAETWFYSDSINDAPLLQEVDHPIVVDGDARLLALAEEKNWKVTSFRT